MYSQPLFLRTLSRFAVVLPARYDLETALGELTESVTGVLDTRLVTFSNGAAIVAPVFSSEQGSASTSNGTSGLDAGVWKPAPGAYAYAAQQCNVEPIDMMLAAVHPWDIDGANRAGLGTASINQTGATYPDYYTPPTT